MDNNTINKKSSRKKWMFLGLGLITTGVLSFFGYKYYKENKKKSESSGSDAPDFKAEKPKTPPKKAPAPKSKKPSLKKPAPPKPAPKPETNTAAQTFPDYFPLKKGSQGERVRQLQQALIGKNGAGILPRGATGIYDSDLQAALKKLSLPEIIDETTYNVLVTKTKVDPALIARGLQMAIKAKSFKAAIKILKVIKSSAQYTSVNKVFSNYFINGVRQTIVNAVLSTFKDEKQKQEIRLAFAAMGLKYDGKKWSLEGLDGKPLLITTQTTKVWKDPRTSVEVPKNMVLGKQIEQRKNFTLFENDKQFFLVESRHVNYYKN